MKLFVAVLGSLLLLAVAAFCVFGFMATFEPTDNVAQFMAFRIGYAVIALGCIVGMVDGQAKDDESGQVQAKPPSLVSGGVLRMISPVSETFK